MSQPAVPLSFLFVRPAHFLALGLGAGLSPVAPGTFGTLVAWPIAWGLHATGSDAAYLAVTAVLFALGIGALVTLVLVLVVTLLAAMGGGKKGRRYHRKVDHALGAR